MFGTLKNPVDIIKFFESFSFHWDIFEKDQSDAEKPVESMCVMQWVFKQDQVIDETDRQGSVDEALSAEREDSQPLTFLPRILIAIKWRHFVFKPRFLLCW